jgi:hypothetical protein
MKFDFAMAMGVRNGDTARKDALNKLIAAKTDQIRSIIADYQIPLLPISKQALRKDND